MVMCSVVCLCIVSCCVVCCCIFVYGVMWCFGFRGVLCVWRVLLWCACRCDLVCVVLYDHVIYDVVYLCMLLCSEIRGVL